QPAFFRQISDMGNMFGGQGLAHEEKTAAVLSGNLVYNPYKGGLPGPIWAQKSINAVLWDFKGDVAQGRFVSVGFGNIFGHKDMIHSNNFFKDMELHPKPIPLEKQNPPLNKFKDGKKIAMKKKIRYWSPNINSKYTFFI